MKLQQLFVFNPTLSMDEDTADENILCFYPPDTAIDWQMNEVGFCTAIVRMMERFGAVADIGKPMGITLASKRYVIVKVERNVFAAAVINREAFRNVFSAQSHHVTVWDSSLVTASQDDIDDVAEDVISRLIFTFYRMFAMMFGSVTNNYNKIMGNGGVNSSNLQTPRRSPAPSSATAKKKPTNHFRRSADLSEKKRQQHALRSVISVGFVDKLVPVLTETSKMHDLEGTFATPAGVEVLPLFPDTYLQITALMGHLMTAHAAAITNAVVSVGPKVAYSSLSVEDTVTLFQLMLHYEERVLSDKKQQQKAPSGPVSSSAPLSVGEYAEAKELAEPYSPDEIIRSEQRRSEFLWTRQSEVTRKTGGSSRSLSLPRSFSLPRSRQQQKQNEQQQNDDYPFIFIDDEPRGVITLGVGAFKIFLLVRDKFLQHSLLRSGLIESIEQTLRMTTVGAPLHVYASPGAEKAKILDSIILFHFQSLMIRQVKSSIVSRLIPTAGSLCAPASATVPSQPLKSSERVLIHRLDMLREAIRTGKDSSSLCRVTNDAWASHIAAGPRELSTAVLGKESVTDAEAALNGLINYVFFFSLKNLS